MAAGVVAGATDDATEHVHGGTFGPGVDSTTKWWGTSYGSVPEWAITYDGNPGWWVTVDSAGDVDALRDWAGSSEDREIMQVNADSNRVLVAAPLGHIGTTTFAKVMGSGLQANDYVTRISLVHEVGLPEPPDLSVNRSDVSGPVSDAAVSGGWAQYQSGVAYSENFEQSTMKEARAVVNATGDRPTGDGLTVGVLDTGINTANGRVFGNSSSGSPLRITASKNFVTGETGLSAVEDGNGHGTWVASAIAANHSNESFDGVVPDANLVVGKVLSDDGSGSMDSIIQGLEWMSDNQSVDVISMSLGSNQYSSALAREIREVVQDTDVSAVVVAAGNSRQTIRYLSTPADVRGDNAQSDGIITVAATNVSEPDAAATTYFSSVGPDGGVRDGSAGTSRGALPTVAAPGAKIEAATPTTSGGVGYSTLSGTSMATPITSGVVTALLDAHSDFQGDPGTVEQHLAYTTQPIQKAGYTEAGAGMIDLEEAVETTDVSGSSYYDRQKSARTDPAKRRDDANAGFAGMNPLTRQLAGLSSRLSFEIPSPF